MSTRDLVTDPGAGPPRSADDATRPPIEIGWILAGPLDEQNRSAARRAREAMLAELKRVFPNFRWHLTRVERRAVSEEQRRQPEQLLEIAASERDLHRWDVTFVVTDGDLVTHRKPFAFGAPSRAAAAAVVSTARLLPDLEDLEAPDEVMARRLKALSLHVFGHLGLLDDEPRDAWDYMYDFSTADELDAMERFAEDDVAALREQLQAIADPRLEETAHRLSTAAFYLRAAWSQRREILGSIQRIEPWLFPLRFSRLTTAAASAMVILCVTAESWELGMSQPPLRVAIGSVLCILGVSVLLLHRQRLLGAYRSADLRELKVVSDVSVTLATIFGMSVIYLLLYTSTYAIASTFFAEHVVESWTASLEHVGELERLVFSGFVALLGLIVGALGASFEEQSYFRHITLVDEET